MLSSMQSANNETVNNTSKKKRKTRYSVYNRMAQLKLPLLELWNNLPYFIRSRKDQVILVTLHRNSLG